MSDRRGPPGTAHNDLGLYPSVKDRRHSLHEAHLAGRIAPSTIHHALATARRWRYPRTDLSADQDRDDTRSPAVVVAGMHRSATSLVASIVAALGYSMGARQLRADAANPHGYFEDLDFLEFNQRMLAASTPSDDGGHPDWGWTEHEQLHRDRFAAFEAEARALVTARAQAGQPWGWKDPCTTVTLDFWNAILGDALYILVYRFPWEVADSMQRLGADVFLRHPEYAYRIWSFYNRQVMAFCRRHGDRCILVSANALMRGPERFVDLLRRRLGVRSSVGEITTLIDGTLFRARGGADPLAALVVATHPECAAILSDLEAAADMPAGDVVLAGSLKAPRPALSPAVSVVIPCFDQGEFLIDAVASVERSVAVPYELLIANDGSREPRTRDILAILRQAGYRILDQDNQGLGATRNRLFAEAAAEAVMPLDADNQLRPGFIEPALEVLAHAPDVAAVYGDRMDFGLRSEHVKVGDFDADALLYDNYIDACALIRKRAWRECGGYEERLPEPGLEDWDLWLSLIQRGWRLHYLPMPAFDYRVRPDSMLRAFDDPAVFGTTRGYIIGKHAAGYIDRLRRYSQSLRDAAARSADLSTTNETLMRERELLATEIEVCRSHDRRLRDEFTAARADAQHLLVDLEAVRGEAGRLRAEDERLRIHVDALQREGRHLRGELESAQEENRGLCSDLDYLRGEHGRLHGELVACRDYIAAIESTKTWRARVRLRRLLGE